MNSISALFLPPMDNYDIQLALEGEDICRLLNLPTHVRRITWVDRDVWSAFPSDDCGFFHEEGLFPAHMKGRLEPKEWRPLMCSRRIYKRIRRDPPLSVFFGMIATLFLVMIVGAGLVSGQFGNTRGSWVILFILLAEVPIFFVVYARGTRRQKLQADLLASRVEGKQEFLSVLRKIQSLGLSDVVKTEGRGLSRYFSSRPSIAERIHNLELFKG